MSSPFTPPSFNATSYNCPHCNAFSAQIWLPVLVLSSGSYSSVQQLKYTICAHCNCYQLWHEGKMIYPVSTLTPMPNIDMPQDVKADYDEARIIIAQSPRGGTALLRLAMQKLCKHLGEPGENINTDIKSLVSKGLPLQIQQALDIVRVIGNDAVHPGQIDITDDVVTATALFGLLNLIVEDRITRPKEIEAMYQSLPHNKLEGIKARDKNI